MAARKLTVYKEAAQALAQFEKDYGSILVDCSTPKGMKSAKDCRKEIRDARSNLEDLRKETKEPALAKCKQIDSEAKAIKEKLDVLFTKFDSGIKAIENKKEIEAKEKADAVLKHADELDAREAAIYAKEIELGLREPDDEHLPEGSADTGDSGGDTEHLNRSPRNKRKLEESIAELDDSAEQVSTICEPHIKVAAERLHVLKRIRALVEPTDAQPTGEIDEEIARTHDEVIAEVWELVDVFK